MHWNNTHNHPLFVFLYALTVKLSAHDHLDLSVLSVMTLVVVITMLNGFLDVDMSHVHTHTHTHLPSPPPLNTPVIAQACESRTASCRDCIQTPGCVWCADIVRLLMHILQYIFLAHKNWQLFLLPPLPPLEGGYS